MIKREFLDDSLGQQFGATEEPVEPDNDTAWGQVDTAFGDPVQVAGIRLPTGGFVRGLLKSAKPKTAVPKPKPKEDDVSEVMKGIREEVQLGKTVREMEQEAGIASPGAPLPKEKISSESGINLDRLGSGSPAQDYVTLATAARHSPEKILATVERAEQLADTIEAVGKSYELTEDPHTFAQIKKRGPQAILKSLEPLLSGEQRGLANDTQVYGFKLLVQALGDKTAALANQIDAGDTSPETLLKYEDYARQLVAVVSQARGNTRETARALSAHRMIATTLNNPTLDSLDMALRESAGDPAALIQNARAYAQALRNGEDPVLAQANSMKRRTWLEAGIEYWKASLLSSIPTHVINSGSMFAVTAYENGLRGLATVSGAVRRGFGAQDTYSLEEGAYSTFASVRGLIDGMKAFGEVLVTNESKFGPGGKDVGPGAQQGVLSQKLGETFGRTGEIAGDVLTGPLRLLRAEDELFKTVLYRQELSGLAARQGVKKGLRGEKLGGYVEGILSNPPEDLHQQALQYAKVKTFQDTDRTALIGQIGESVARFAEHHQWAQFLIPFVRTTTNIIEYGVEASALSAVSPRIYKAIIAGGPEADIAIAKLTAGAGMSVMAYLLYSKGMITGNGPDNLEQRKALEATGWQPNSIKIGDTYYGYNRADPFAMVLSSVASAMDAARFGRTEEEVAQMTAGAVGAFAERMLESSFVNSFKGSWEAFSALAFEQNPKAAAALVANISTGVVPYSSLFAAGVRSQDAEIKAMSKPTEVGFGGQTAVEDLGQIFGQTWRARFARDSLRPKRQWDGTVVVPEAGDLALFALPVPMSSVKHDPASKALVENGIKIREPLPQISFGPVTFNVLDLDGGKGMIYDRYIQLVGEQRKAAVNDAVRGTKYLEAGPGSARARVLDEAIAAGTAAGRQMFQAELVKGKLAIEGEYKEVFESQYTLEKMVKEAMKGERESTDGMRFRGGASPVIKPNVEF